MALDTMVMQSKTSKQLIEGNDVIFKPEELSHLKLLLRHHFFQIKGGLGFSKLNPKDTNTFIL